MVLARAVASSGEYALPAHHLPLQFDGDRRNEPIRAYVLPGEALLLAGAFRTLPVPLHRYIHVPITVAFVVAIAAVALVSAGRKAALATGVLANLDPFVVQHGPVWDDALLAAALQWSFLAIVVHRLSDRSIGRTSRTLVAAAGVIAFCAALTRTQPQLELAIIGAALAALPRLRAARALGVATIAGAGAAMTTWGARNLLVLGTVLLTTSHDGLTLLQSNHLRARESILQTGVAQTLAPVIPDPGGGELEIDAAARREAMAYLRAHPGDAAMTAGLKTFVSVVGVDFASRRAARNAVAVSSSIVLLTLAVIGWREWRRRRRPGAIASVLAVSAATIGGVTLLLLLIGPVGIRYRIAATGFVYVLAGIGITSMRSRSNSGPHDAARAL
jgi:hypothetical protein